MTTYQAAVDGGTLEWVLEIAGLTARYYSGPVPPPTKAHDLAIAAGDYEDVPAIVALSDYSERVEQARGWYEGGSVVVELASVGSTAAPSTDPCRVLATVGRRGATSYAQVITPITSGSVSFDLDRAWTGGASGVCHVDREAIEYTYAGGPPYTMTIVGRAKLGSWSQRHNTDRLAALLPECTSPVSHWLGRPAYLYYAVRYPGARELSAPVLWAPMIITASPSLRGPSVSLSLAPVSSLLDRTTGGELQRSRTVGLLQGVHRFWDDSPHVWSVVQELAASSVRPLDAVAGAAGVTTLTAASWSRYSTCYCPQVLSGSGPGGAAASYHHPRWGHVCTDDAVIFTTREATGAAAPVIQHPAWVPALAGATVVTPAYDGTERIEVDITAGATTDIVWPDGLAALVAARSAASVASAAGMWCSVSLGPSSITAALNGGVVATWSPGARVCVEWTETETEPGSYTPADGRLGGGLWDERPQTWVDGAGVSVASTLSRRDQVLYPIRPTASATEAVVADRGAGLQRDAFLRISARPQGEPVSAPAVLALGWYESGEPYMLCDSDPGISGTQSVEITWSGPSGTSRTVQVEVVGPASAVAVAGASGYILALRYPRGVPSFGDWPDQPRATITPVISWGGPGGGVPSSSVLLSLLLAGGDDATWGDSQPWGLGLPAALVDSASIEAIPDPPGVGGWTMTLGPDSDLAALIESILVLTGYQMVIRRTDTGARLAAVPSGLVAREAVGVSVSEGGLVGRPESTLDEQVVSGYHVTVRTGEGSDELTYVDQRSVATHGQGETLDIDLRGLDVGSGTEPVLTLLQPVIARCAETLGSPRRLWRVDVPLRDAIALYPGAAVSVTSRDLYGLSGPPGVTAATARVQAVTHRLMGAGASLELTYHGVECTLIHAAMLGDVLDVDSITVSETRHTDGEDPSRGVPWLDTDDFRVGDQVYLSRLAGPDSTVTRTIAAIVSLGGGLARVDLTAAHGLAGTVRIVHRSRTLDPARLAGLCYLSPWAAGGAYSYS